MHSVNKLVPFWNDKPNCEHHYNYVLFFPITIYSIRIYKLIIITPKVDKLWCEEKEENVKIEWQTWNNKKKECGVSDTVLIETYDIGKSTIYDIKKAKIKILGFIASSEAYNKIAERKGLHWSKLENFIKVLHEWFLLKWSKGMAISGPMPIAKENILGANEHWIRVHI